MEAFCLVVYLSFFYFFARVKFGPTINNQNGFIVLRLEKFLTVRLSECIIKGEASNN